MLFGTALSISGMFFTAIFSVDPTHVSVADHDAQLELLLEGRPEANKGKLSKKEHLSLFELWTGCHGTYEPGRAKQLVEGDLSKAQENASVTIQ
jgi:hypothetical protein